MNSIIGLALIDLMQASCGGWKILLHLSFARVSWLCPFCIVDWAKKRPLPIVDPPIDMMSEGLTFRGAETPHIPEQASRRSRLKVEFNARLFAYRIAY